MTDRTFRTRVTEQETGVVGPSDWATDQASRMGSNALQAESIRVECLSSEGNAEGRSIHTFEVTAVAKEFTGEGGSRSAAVDQATHKAVKYFGEGASWEVVEQRNGDSLGNVGYWYVLIVAREPDA